MSDARLLCWPTGHGLALETRGGMFEALVDAKSGRSVRFCNSLPVDGWPENSRTAGRLEDLFTKVRGELAEMNELRASDLVEAYRAKFWEVREILKAE